MLVKKIKTVITAENILLWAYFGDPTHKLQGNQVIGIEKPFDNFTEKLNQICTYVP